MWLDLGLTREDNEMIKPGTKVRIYRIGKQDATYNSPVKQKYLDSVGILESTPCTHPGGYVGCRIDWIKTTLPYMDMSFYHVQLQEVK
jgi:hypothetical protein